MPKQTITEVVRVNGVVKALRGTWGERSKEEVIKDIEERDYVYLVKDGMPVTVVHFKDRQRAPYIRSVADPPFKLDNLGELPRRLRLRIYGQTQVSVSQPVQLVTEARDVSGALGTDTVEWTWSGRKVSGSTFRQKLAKGTHSIAASITHLGLTAKDQFRVQVT